MSRCAYLMFDRQCARQASVGDLCKQHANMAEQEKQNAAMGERLQRKREEENAFDETVARRLLDDLGAPAVKTSIKAVIDAFNRVRLHDMIHD